jgi:hypothetical protein
MQGSCQQKKLTHTIENKDIILELAGFALFLAAGRGQFRQKVAETWPVFHGLCPYPLRRAGRFASFYSNAHGALRHAPVK